MPLTGLKAVISCARGYSAESTSENLKHWDKAKDAFETMKKQLCDKYDTSEETQTKRFSTQAMVLSYLKDQGFKIEKSTLSNHVRSGFLKKKNGVFSQKDVDDYGRIHLQDSDSGEKESDKKTRDLQAQKLKNEIALKKEQFLKAKMEREILEGKHVPRETIEIEQAAKAAVVDSGIVHTIRANSAAWIDLVGGDQAKERELIQSMIDAFRVLVNEYASAEVFTVKFEGVKA
jgi:hypothetical protein